MTQVKKTIQMNRLKKAIIKMPIFRETMSFKRFLRITRFLHLTNNNTVENIDKLEEIKPVITFLCAIVTISNT